MQAKISNINLNKRYFDFVLKSELLSKFGSSWPEMFCKKDALKKIIKINRKHRVGVSFLIKLQASSLQLIKKTSAQVFSREL